MAKDKGIRTAFHNIKEDMHYLYNHIEEAKATQQSWLNNLINNQNNQSHKMQEMEHRLQKIEQQMDLVLQTLQTRQNNAENEQNWMLVRQR